MNLLCGHVTVTTVCESLHIKTNQQDIAVLDSIVLALNAELTDFPSFGQ
jgi:hypothetical protein